MIRCDLCDWAIGPRQPTFRIQLLERIPRSHDLEPILMEDGSEEKIVCWPCMTSKVLDLTIAGIPDMHSS